MRRLLVILAALTLLLAACGDDGDDPVVEGTGPDDTAIEDDSGDGAAGDSGTVQVASSDLGDILVDSEGMTLYLFTNDTEGESVCTGQCAEVWPPLTADGEATAGDGVDAGKLGTITRDDGSPQVTYNGHPLYYYAPDQEPGDTTGQGVNDVWFVVNPAGEAVGMAAASTGDPMGY